MERLGARAGRRRLDDGGAQPAGEVQQDLDPSRSGSQGDGLGEGNGGSIEALGGGRPELGHRRPDRQGDRSEEEECGRERPEPARDHGVPGAQARPAKRRMPMPFIVAPRRPARESASLEL